MLLMIDNYDSFTYATNVRLRVGGTSFRSTRARSLEEWFGALTHKRGQL